MTINGQQVSFKIGSIQTEEKKAATPDKGFQEEYEQHYDACGTGCRAVDDLVGLHQPISSFFPKDTDNDNLYNQYQYIEPIDLGHDGPVFRLDRHVVHLSGPSSSGKTQLALQWAAHVVAQEKTNQVLYLSNLVAPYGLVQRLKQLLQVQHAAQAELVQARRAGHRL